MMTHSRFTTLVALTTVGPLSAAARAAGPSLVTVATFDRTHGATPGFGPLLLDSAGNLFGTTEAGGASNLGTVFEVSAAARGGKPTVLTSFAGGLGGSGPSAGLIRDAAGDLFGTTGGGGLATDAGSGGSGTVFEIPTGTTAAVPLAAFNFATTGAFPIGTLARGPDGGLYGTTGVGGTGSGGTAFRFDPVSHALSVAAPLSSATGEDPVGGVIADPAGNLFGTALFDGGANHGTLYKVAAGTTTATPVVSFDGANTGDGPEGGLTRDAAGDLFGTTSGSGPGGDGTVFELPAGATAVRTLATFNGTNGMAPHAALLADAAGDLFGTTAGGGAAGDGTAFELPAGSATIVTLATFAGTANGANPQASLVADAAGDLFGTTNAGGASNVGTVFEVTGSGFVVPEPAAASVLAAACVGRLLGRRRRSR